jgi:hypothetical protein
MKPNDNGATMTMEYLLPVSEATDIFNCEVSYAMVEPNGESGKITFTASERTHMSDIT